MLAISFVCRKQVLLLSIFAAHLHIRSICTRITRTLNIELSLLNLCLAFLPIRNLPFDLFEHHRKATKPILISKLIMMPESALILAQCLLPLPRVRALRLVGRVRYHIKQRFILVADWRHVRLLLLQAVFVILPELTQLDVAELRYLHQILSRLPLLVLGCLRDNIRRELNILHDGLICISLIQLEDILVSCVQDCAVLRLVHMDR